MIPIVIGFQNKGDSSFTITEIDGSFRHPAEFSYHIQNVSELYSYTTNTKFQFTTVPLDTVVKPNQVASFNYYIRPYDAFEPRQIGLQVSSYRQEQPHS